MNAKGSAAAKGPVPLMGKLLPPPPGMEDNMGEDGEKEAKLPSALEEVLKLKEQRAKQLGIKIDEVDKINLDEPTKPASSVNLIPRSLVPLVDDVSEKKKKDKTQRRKKKKKRNKKNRGDINENREADEDKEDDDNEGVEIEYVTEDLSSELSDPMYRQFLRVFESFKMAEAEAEPTPAVDVPVYAKEPVDPKSLTKVPKTAEEDDDDDDELEKDPDEKPKLSKRKLKKLTRMTVADLKQTATRPDVVEMHDVTAKDPKLLVLLKAYRNSVGVPRHWCFKRKYLQGKRGIEKPPFQLPEFIERTGIMEMRAALQEKEEQKTLKTKMREKVRPKLGKIDIDYEKLHDAFFKWQTKPKMSIHGDLYYEGKEFETKLKEKKPGDLTEELRIALGMPVGPSASKFPPPWLIAMQRYGPAPSYPNLKIPGLNAPIPDGCSFGYHAGGWGKPPVDEMGRPLYGDVFGTATEEPVQPEKEPEEPEKTELWGELESEEEEEEESSEEEEEEDQTGLATPAEGLETPSGVASVPAGLETPEMIELRKRRIEQEMEGGETPALYTILPERRTDRVGQAMMGSTHTYDVAATSQKSGGVELALEPSELEDMDAVAARYEQAMKEQNRGDGEDLSDLVAEHNAKQRTKRKRQAQHKEDKDKKDPKRYKEFKF